MKLLPLVLLLSACGVKVGSGVVIGTTSFLEEVNRGAFTSDLEHRVRETITEDDRAKLSVRLAEVK
jgi:hypothetical protein